MGQQFLLSMILFLEHSRKEICVSVCLCVHAHMHSHFILNRFFHPFGYVYGHAVSIYKKVVDFIFVKAHLTF